MDTSSYISPIAYLICAALEQHSQCSADSYKEYQQALATVVGLGFTAILSEGSRVESCVPHVTIFLQCRDFIQRADKIEIVSVSIAEIICNAIPPFNMLKHPSYYHNFRAALMTLLKSSSADNPKIDKKIESLLRELFSRCH